MITKITLDLMSRLLREREPDTHKNDYGNALLVAGSRGMMGAAVLAARAAMRSGVGLLTVRVPRCGYEIMQMSVPEAKCATDRREEHHAYIDVPKGIDAIAIGPGMGLDVETQEAVCELLGGKLSEPGMPDPALVIDADGLNILSLHPELLERLPKETILTPHVGEAKRLLASTGCGNCSQLAMQYRLVVVLKSHVTNIYLPNGDQLRNEELGNPGMAVGGSGDTLTGILVGLRAQGYSARDAAALGVGLHALAADLAIEEGDESEESLLPSDITRWIGRAFRKVKG